MPLGGLPTRLRAVSPRELPNLGLPAVEAPTGALAGADVDLSLADGVLRSDGTTVPFARPPEMMLEMVRAGGLLAMVLARRTAPVPPTEAR